MVAIGRILYWLLKLWGRDNPTPPHTGPREEGSVAVIMGQKCRVDPDVRPAPVKTPGMQIYRVSHLIAAHSLSTSQELVRHVAYLSVSSRLCTSTSL